MQRVNKWQPSYDWQIFGSIAAGVDKRLPTGRLEAQTKMYCRYNPLQNFEWFSNRHINARSAINKGGQELLIMKV